MSNCKRLLALALAVTVLCALGACATTGKCGLRECPEEAALRADVEKVFSQYQDLRPPNMVYVQVRDHTVTLSGQVNTDYARNTAESVALQVQGVAKVVNLISLTYSAR
jgi:osmotically-inducible protein OsmY